MTARQKELLDYLRRELPARDGVAPSFAEMAAALGQTSKGNIARLLDALERQNKIVRDFNRARSIRLAGADLTRVPDAALLAEAARRGLLGAAK